MAEVNERIREFSALGASVYGLSVDSPRQAAAMQEEMGLGFGLLCDPGRKLVKRLGLFNPYEAGGIAKPAVVILDRKGVVCYLALEKPHMRVPVSELLEFLGARLSNSGHQVVGSPSRLGRVDAGAMVQVGRNLLLRGNWNNWRHVLLAPLEGASAVRGLVAGPQRVLVARDYPAKPEEVFPHLADPELMSRFLDAKLTRIADSPSDKKNPNGVGSVRRVKIGPASLEETITRLEPPHLCQYVISKGSPLKNYTGTITVFGKKGGSRVVWTMAFEARIPYTGQLFAAAMHAGFSKGLKNLDRFLK